MKILVCISHVPDTTSKINFTNNNTEFDSNGITYVINPYDEFGLTRAMVIKETSGATVTVINVGPSSTEPTLRKALAIGADNAVRINAEPTDANYVARLLANYAKNENFDLIITGRESIDYNGGVVPGMLATYLDIPFVNACLGLELNGNQATVIREIDGGWEGVQFYSLNFKLDQSSINQINGATNGDFNIKSIVTEHYVEISSKLPLYIEYNASRIFC